MLDYAAAMADRAPLTATRARERCGLPATSSQKEGLDEPLTSTVAGALGRIRTYATGSGRRIAGFLPRSPDVQNWLKVLFRRYISITVDEHG